MSRRTGWIVLILIGVSSSALGQQRYELRPRFTVGQRWSESRTNTFEMATAVKVQQQVVEQNRQKTRNVIEIEWEVLAVADGSPTAARVVFGDRCGTEIEQNGQTQTMKFPVAGATVEARRLPGGGVDIKPPSANVPEVLELLEDLFEPDAGAYPRQPVAVGESWSWDKSTVAENFGLGPQDKGAVTCTLKAVSVREGRETAQVTFKVELEKGDAQEDQSQRIATLTESTLNGQGLVDVAAGRLVEFDLSGPVTVGGIIYGRDESGNMAPQADLDGNGRMALKSRARLLSDKGTSTPTLTTGGGGADFAGEYSNSDMTLTLEPAADGFGGKLRFGESEFPVRAKLAGSALKGAFQSDGNWFDFDATLGNGTLMLSTGGKTHALKKKVTAKNPLGEASAPRNPLNKAQPANP